MSQVKINVTQEDILKGTRGSTSDCAIAVAIQRELDRRDRLGICVGGGNIIVDGKYYQLPKKSAQFIHKFDNNKAKSKPFSFMLREAKPMEQRQDYNLACSSPFETGALVLAHVPIIL